MFNNFCIFFKIVYKYFVSDNKQKIKIKKQQKKKKNKNVFFLNF